MTPPQRLSPTHVGMTQKGLIFMVIANERKPYSFLTDEKLGPSEPFDERISYFGEILKKSRGDVVFLCGAGVSTGSGIPDFRGKDGLYNGKDEEFRKYQPEFLLSHNCYAYKPQVFYKFYRKYFDLRRFEPCPAHKAIAQLEHDGFVSGVITQNVDTLHEKAGSKNIMKIHGTTNVNHCVRCGREYDDEWFFSNENLVPRCNCGGQVRPNVVLYGEKMPADAYERAKAAVDSAKCIVVAGTSLTVGAPARFVSDFSGSYLVIINGAETQFDYLSDVCFREDMNEVLDKVVHCM